ncbi:hypothetical protein WDZ92_30260, partial [Nostoc sp. NIES-2111]
MSQEIKAPDPAPLSATVATALRRAFNLGQTYWQQADSDSYSQNAKSDITRGKFEALLEETTAAVAAIPAPEGADEQPTWSGATPFLRQVQSATGSAGETGDWGDEFLAWYQPDHWFGEHRAAAVFLGSKIAALAAPAPLTTDAELERRTGEPHVDGWPLVSGLPSPAEGDEPACWIDGGDLEQLAKLGMGGVLGWPDNGNDPRRVPLYTRPATEPHDSRGPTTLEGWRSAALDGEKERDWLRERLRLITRHQEKDCWYWQNDGEDHLESMTNALPVVIRADHLRALLANVQPKHTAEPVATVAGGDGIPSCIINQALPPGTKLYGAAQAPAPAHRPETAMTVDNTFGAAFLKLQELMS